MPASQSGFFRGRRLPAGTENADHPPDAGKSSQGAADDSASPDAEDRSGDGRGRAAGKVVEIVEVVIPGRCKSIEPGISRFRVWCWRTIPESRDSGSGAGAPTRNDGVR